MLRQESLEQLDGVGRPLLLERDAREADPAARVRGIERRRLLERGASLARPSTDRAATGRGASATARSRRRARSTRSTAASASSIWPARPLAMASRYHARALTIVERHGLLVGARALRQTAVGLAHHAERQPVAPPTVGSACDRGRAPPSRRPRPRERHRRVESESRRTSSRRQRDERSRSSSADRDRLETQRPGRSVDASSRPRMRID